MFSRTLAVSLGEVRQPTNSAQCLRASRTAGAILAGYFPHLRGTFSFPAHLAGVRSLADAPQCTATHQNPQIASLLCAHDQQSTEAPGDISSFPGQVDAKGVYTDRDAVRDSVVGTLMAREYGPKMGRLEQKCLALYAANQQLQRDAEKAHTSTEKTRDLNRRLCREVNEARMERTVALEEVERLKQQTRKQHDELKQIRAENLSLHNAFKDSQRQVIQITEALNAQHEALELSRLQSETPRKLSNLDETCQTDWSTVGENSIDDQGPDPALLMVSPVSFDSDQNSTQSNSFDTECKCNHGSTWGCALHHVYSGSLLLAHRDIALRISQGPPGLEAELPLGLEYPRKQDLQHSWCSSLRLVPA